MRRDDSSQIAAEIVRYLESHPDAEDSAEGIAYWWLHDRSRKSVGVIYNAIQKLISEDVIEVVSHPNGVIRYRKKRPF